MAAYERHRIEYGELWNLFGPPCKGLVRHRFPLLGSLLVHRKARWPLHFACWEMRLRRWHKKAVIDVADTVNEGGIYSCRHEKTTSGESGERWSRHAWAIAIDINPSRVPFGVDYNSLPRRARRRQAAVARLMAKWGFYQLPHDMMHFELAVFLSRSWWRRLVLRARREMA